MVSEGAQKRSAAHAPSRFSDPQGRYAVLYASEAVRCAFWETMGRNRLARRRRRELPRIEVESRLVVSIRSTEPLGLIDLRGDGPVRIGAPSAVSHDGNHAAGRALSAAVHAGGRVGGWRADFRVRWLFRRFRSSPQSGSHGLVSSPPLIKPDMRISRIRLSDKIMPSRSKGPGSSA